MSCRTLLLAAASAAALVGAGCRGEPGFHEVVVAEARLEEFDVTQVGLLGGATQGSAILHVVDVDGAEHRASVGLDGAMLGVVFLVVKQVDLFGPTTVQLSLPGGGPVTGDMLFGVYDGETAGGALIAGVGHHDLENDHGVGIDVTSFAMGMGIMIGAEWLGVDFQSALDAAEADGT